MHWIATRLSSPQVGTVGARSPSCAMDLTRSCGEKPGRTTLTTQMTVTAQLMLNDSMLVLFPI